MRVGDSVWYCTGNNDEFNPPIEIRTRLGHFTVMGKSGYSDIVEFGDKISSYLTAIAQPYRVWCDVFSEGDLFYCNGAKPSSDEEYYGQNANYVVDNVDYGNERIKLTLKKVV